MTTTESASPGVVFVGPKRCRRCRRFQSREAFARNRSRLDGLNDWCRPCAAEAFQLRKLPRHTCALPPGKRVCRTCNSLKRDSDFYLRKKKRKGLEPWRDTQCRDCQMLESYERRQIKRAQYDEARRIYESSEKRKAARNSPEGKARRVKANREWRRRRRLAHQLRTQHGTGRTG
jgi:hypothetical protein